jgi:energy-coupling factor transport system permease protein
MLTSLNPLSKLCVCIIWLAFSMLIFDARFQLLLIVSIAFTLVVVNRTSPLMLLALMVPFLLFGSGFLTTSLLFWNESDVAEDIVSSSLSNTQGFSAGLTLLMRTIACGIISTFFALTTDSYGLVRALMVYGRLPARIGYSLFVAMVLIPDLASEAQQMRMARAMKAGRPMRRLPGPKEVLSLIVPLLAFAIRRAGRVAVALEARGFAPESPRTVINVPGFNRSDLVFIGLALGTISLCVFATELSFGR